MFSKLPRRRAWRVRMPNHVSTWFIQDALVGVKWNVNRGCFASHAWTSGVLWVLTLSSTTSTSPRGYVRASSRRKARKSSPVWRSRAWFVTCPVATSRAANRDRVPLRR